MTHLIRHEQVHCSNGHVHVNSNVHIDKLWLNGKEHRASPFQGFGPVPHSAPTPWHFRIKAVVFSHRQLSVALVEVGRLPHKIFLTLGTLHSPTGCSVTKFLLVVPVADGIGGGVVLALAVGPGEWVARVVVSVALAGAAGVLGGVGRRSEVFWQAQFASQA